MEIIPSDRSESRFSVYVEGIVEAIGHADRATPLRDYCLGLLMPGERKSVSLRRSSRCAARTRTLA